MPRPPRILQNEYPYHITTQTVGKVFFFKKWTYKIIIQVLVEAAKKYDVKIHHFKMMHTHYHALVTTPASNISKFERYVNHSISIRLNRRMGRKGHLWGKRFSATIVDTEEYLGKCTKYIYLNGVRAGICARASEDEQLSTFEFYAQGKKVEFNVVEDCVYLMMGNSSLERQEYFLATMDEPVNELEIKAIRSGLRKLFYGSSDFMDRMTSKYLNKN